VAVGRPVLRRGGGPPAAEVRDWRRLLSQEEEEEAVAALRSHLRRRGVRWAMKGSWRAWRLSLAAPSTDGKPGPPTGHKRKRR
jgi:hypothetical protein